MSIKYEFQGNICHISTTGKFSKSDLDKYFQKMYQDPNFTKCKAILLHDQKSMYIPSTEDIRSVASGLRKNIGGFDGKIAVVAETAVKYGMGRMLETVSHDPDIRVFKTYEEAREWVEAEMTEI
jgi:hypothetical protein